MALTHELSHTEGALKKWLTINELCSAADHSTEWGCNFTNLLSIKRAGVFLLYIYISVIDWKYVFWTELVNMALSSQPVSTGASEPVKTNWKHNFHRDIAEVYHVIVGSICSIFIKKIAIFHFCVSNIIKSKAMTCDDFLMVREPGVARPLSRPWVCCYVNNGFEGTLRDVVMIYYRNVTAITNKLYSASITKHSQIKIRIKNGWDGINWRPLCRHIPPNLSVAPGTLECYILTSRW